MSDYQGSSAERKQAGGGQGPKRNCNLLGHNKANGNASPKFHSCCLLFFQFSQLLAEFSLQIADHLCRWLVRELFRELAASCEFDFYCLLFTISIHDCRAKAEEFSVESGL